MNCEIKVWIIIVMIILIWLKSNEKLYNEFFEEYHKIKQEKSKEQSKT